MCLFVNVFGGKAQVVHPEVSRVLHPEDLAPGAPLMRFPQHS